MRLGRLCPTTSGYGKHRPWTKQSLATTHYATVQPTKPSSRTCWISWYRFSPSSHGPAGGDQSNKGMVMELTSRGPQMTETGAGCSGYSWARTWHD